MKQRYDHPEFDVCEDLYSTDIITASDILPEEDEMEGL